MCFKTKVSLLLLALFIGAGVFSMSVQPAEAASLTELQQIIEQLKKQIAELQERLAAVKQGQEDPVEWCHDFNKNLKYGDKDAEVVSLQTAMKKQGFAEAGKDAAGNFGMFTASAVVGFQQKYAKEILDPLGLKYGTGFVGKSTRAKLNKFYECVVEPAHSKITSVNINNPNPKVGDTVEINYTVENIGVDGTITVLCGPGYLPEQHIFTQYLQEKTYTLEKNEQKTDFCSFVVGEDLYQEQQNGKDVIGIVAGFHGKGEAKIWDQTKYEDIIIHSASTTSCTDTDKGIEKYVKGTACKALVAAGEDTMFCRTDRCTDEVSAGSTELTKSYVTEYYCKDSKIFSKTLYCENGCSDGACKGDEIPPSITITSPNGGEEWVVGELYVITWVSRELDNVTIEIRGYDENNNLIGKPYFISDDFYFIGTEGSIDWIVSSDIKEKFGTIPTKYKIRVRNVGLPISVSDESDNYFSIVAPEIGYDKCGYGRGWSEPKNSSSDDTCCCFKHSHIHDLGKIFENKQVLIEYMPGLSKGCESIMVVFSSVDGEQWEKVLTSSVKQETWSPKTIYEKTINVSGEFRYIKIYIPRCYNDYSSAKVMEDLEPSITVISPNGGEEWAISETYSIKWDTVGSLPIIEINLYKGDSYERRLVSGLANDGSDSWTIPADVAPGDDYKIRVEGAVNGVIDEDFSDDYFSIVEKQESCLSRLGDCSDSQGASCCAGLECKEDLWSSANLPLKTCCLPDECAMDAVCASNGFIVESENKKCENGEWAQHQEQIVCGDGKCEQGETPENCPQDCKEKKIIMFNIDQGWANGIIQAQDFVGLRRMIDSMKQFQEKYTVYALVNPMVADKTKLDNVLDILVENNISFLLNAYTSDTMTIGTMAPTINAPYDVSHGIPLSIQQLESYKQKYGSMFVGLSIYEVFGQDFTIMTCKDETLNVDWCDSWSQNLPDDNFFQKELAEQFVEFAKDNNMFVFWSDIHWYALDSWDTIQVERENALQDILIKYQETVIVAYANNDVTARQDGHINDWEQAVNSFTHTKGFGLSDQSWLCDYCNSTDECSYNEMNCPVDEIADWATGAFDKGAILVDLEPSWYLWNLPRGIIGETPDYTIDPAWEDRGFPTSNLIYLANALGVTITISDTETCTDTDGGNNIYEKGTTCRPLTVSNGLFCKTDECASATSLKEYYCGQGSDKGKMMSKTIVCANGCVNGACKQEEQEQCAKEGERINRNPLMGSIDRQCCKGLVENKVSKSYSICEKPTEECHTSDLWSWDYCSPGCKCSAGEGDCDADIDCATGYCAKNVGANYGQDSKIDVCEEK